MIDLKSFRRFAACAAVIAAATGGSAHGAIKGPYTVDANTMHLWHLDESTTPAVDQAHYRYLGTFTDKLDANQPLLGLVGAATLGNASYPGFGTALSTANVSQVPPYPTNSIEPGLSAAEFAVNGTGDNVDHTFDHPTTHAFTMEAIIKFTLNPATTWAQPQEIIAGEGDAGDSSDRSWQFRLQPHTVATDPWVLRFQKVSGFGGVDGGSTANYNLDANIPTTGINAIAQDQWYHVAVTFNGTLSDTTNLKLYWTKLDPANTQAVEIGSGQMNGWLRQQDCDFGLGNEMRDFNGNTEPYIGLIDEVRISDIPRAPSDFLFGPNPANANFNGIGQVDGNDFLIWQQNVGKTGAAATQPLGNANGDNAIDKTDLDIWKSHYGQATIAAIPEPASAALAWCGAALVARIGRRRRAV
jgi:hypothetical protein